MHTHLGMHAGALKVERVLAGGALKQGAPAVGVLAHGAEPGLVLLGRALLQQGRAAGGGGGAQA